VTIDGLFDAGYQSNSYQGVRVSGIEGNGAGTSQIHFRGVEDLGGGLSSIFNLGMDFSPVSNVANQGAAATTTTGGALATQGQASLFGSDEVAVGLAGGFGKVQFGAINNAGVEYVGLISPDFGTAMGGGYKSTLRAETTGGYVRWNNSVRYDTPVISGFQASAIVANKQNGANAASTTVANTTTMGLFNVSGAQELSARYTAGPLKVLVVSSTTQTTGGINDTQRDIGAAYNLSDALSVQVGSQTTALNSATTAYTVSTKSVGSVYTMGQNKFAATFTSLANNLAGKSNASELGLGYDYMLSKTTKLYAHYAHLSDNTAASFTADAGTYLANTTANIRTYTKSAFGIRMDF
jgi:predicted porin